MTKLMEKKDWIQTVANVSAAESVWSEKVSTQDGVLSLAVPEGGEYQVILVKIKSQAIPPKRRSAREFIGYGAKFHTLRTTDEWMKELREGEDD